MKPSRWGWQARFMGSVIVGAMVLWQAASIARSGLTPRPESIANRAAARVDNLFAVMEEGDADAAARALARLLPDGDALLQHHEQVMKSAETARGDMDLALLISACPPYHRWHAQTEITNPARGVATVQWMAQKVWEAPRGPTKDEGAKIIVAIADRWIDKGLMEPRAGLDLAYHAIMAPEFIGPGVSARPLVNLFKKHASTPDKDLTNYIYTSLWEIGRLVDARDMPHGELYDLLKAHFPDRDYPDAAEPVYLFYPRYLGSAAPMTWTEYEEMGTLAPDALRKELKRHDCRSASGGKYCAQAVRFLVAEYDARPEEVGALMTSLLADGSVSGTLLADALLPATPTPEYFDRKAGLVDGLLFQG